MQKTVFTTAFLCFFICVLCLYVQAASGPNPGEELGNVQDLKLSGKVKGYEGEPIAKATIIIPELSKTTETDEKGSFELLMVPPGKYHLQVFAEGYMDYRSEVFELKKSGMTFNIKMMKKLSEEIVVTATRTPKLYAEVPVKTAVISARQIEQKLASQLAEALSLTTGVRVESNCQNCNFTQVRINGMEGKYSQILIDNSPVFGSMIGVYGLEQIPSEMLNRIEIVKGGGSALYGGSAVAGAINVLTKEPMENVSRLRLNQGSISGEPFTNLGASSSLQPVDGDGFSEIGKLRSTNFGINFFNYFPELNGKFKLSFYRITEDRRGGNSFDQPPHEADVAEAIDSDLNGISGEMRAFRQA